MMERLTLKMFLLFLFSSVIFPECFPQRLISGNKTIITLQDKTEIILYPEISETGRYMPYYYLPVNLRISCKNGISEFSFMSYDEDDDSKIDGAIMHMLLTWGLTDLQKAEAESAP